MTKFVAAGVKPKKASEGSQGTGMLKVFAKADGYQLAWGLGEFGSHVEVWESRTNNRAGAVLVRQCLDTYYDSPAIAPGTYYLWTRRVTRYGIAGDFDAAPAVAVVTKK